MTLDISTGAGEGGADGFIVQRVSDGLAISVGNRNEAQSMFGVERDAGGLGINVRETSPSGWVVHVFTYTGDPLVNAGTSYEFTAVAPGIVDVLAIGGGGQGGGLIYGGVGGGGAGGVLYQRNYHMGSNHYFPFVGRGGQYNRGKGRGERGTSSSFLSDGILFDDSDVEGSVIGQFAGGGGGGGGISEEDNGDFDALMAGSSIPKKSMGSSGGGLGLPYQPDKTPPATLGEIFGLQVPGGLEEDPEHATLRHVGGYGFFGSQYGWWWYDACGGGGGGAGGDGYDHTVQVGQGGVGIFCDICGYVKTPDPYVEGGFVRTPLGGVGGWYAGGGAAMQVPSTWQMSGIGGRGGGGGGGGLYGNGIAGTGGGGGGQTDDAGGFGGSGIVVVRYRRGTMAATGGTIYYLDEEGNVTA